MMICGMVFLRQKSENFYGITFRGVEITSVDVQISFQFTLSVKGSCLHLCETCEEIS